MVVKWTLPFLIFLTASLHLYAEETVRIMGTVRQTGGVAIGGATVTIEPDHRVQTDDQGNYSITVSKGTYTIIVEAQGFGTHGETFTTTEGTELRLDFTLRRSHLEFE